MEEIWKDIPGYEGLYKVSNHGRLIGNNGKIMALPNSHGYARVTLCKDRKKINKTLHSLVMLSFVGDRQNNVVINHIDGNKYNNRVDNLEYCTQSHNIKEDFIYKRRSLVGERNTQAKLKETDVLSIVDLYRAGGQTYRGLAKRFNVHFNAISGIFNGRNWTHLTGIEKKN